VNEGKPLVAGSEPIPRVATPTRPRSRNLDEGADGGASDLSQELQEQAVEEAYSRDGKESPLAAKVKVEVEVEVEALSGIRDSRVLPRELKGRMRAAASELEAAGLAPLAAAAVAAYGGDAKVGAPSPPVLPS
jgi:hypothetical protein